MITIPLSLVFLVAGLFTLFGYLLRVGLENANAARAASAEQLAWRGVWQGEARIIDADEVEL
jgi:hypothetical protein